MAASSSRQEPKPPRRSLVAESTSVENVAVQSLSRRKINDQLWQDRCDDVLTDVKLYCGEDAVSAHRNILCAASSVFRELLLDGSNRDTLLLPDFTAEQFLPLLEFIYKKTTSQFKSTQDIIHALYAARKYRIPELTKFLLERLKTLLNFRSPDEDILSAAVSTLEMSSRLPEEDEQCLVAMASQVAILHLENLLASGRLTFHVLDAVVSAKELEFRIPEENIFRICDLWAAAFCASKDQDPSGANKRSVLGCVINKIHFTDIPESVVSNEVFQSGLLNGDEISSIFRSKHNSSAEVFFSVGVRAGKCLTNIELENETFVDEKVETKVDANISDEISYARYDPLMQKLLVSVGMSEQKIVGDTWFVLPCDWLTRWEDWANGKASSERPRPIDTKFILHKNGDYVNELKSERGNVYYTCVPEKIWNMLVKWFQCNGEPTPRKVINVEDKPVVETALCHFNVQNVVDKSIRTSFSIVSRISHLSVSRAASLHDVERL